MINKTIFRQYDIRGVVNDDLTYENSKLIGYYLGLHIKEKISSTPYIVVGYDVRTHSQMLFEALISGLNLSECKVLKYWTSCNWSKLFCLFSRVFYRK